FAQFGIEATFVDSDDPSSFAPAIRDNTKAVYVETIGNPQLNVADLAAIAAIAHDAGVPLVVDNTLASPYLCRPFEHGADIVIHSVTKYLGGHGTTIAGVVVDGGTFDFGTDRFPDFTEPDPSYNGLQYWPALGPGAFAAKLRVQLLRDTGAAIAPLNSFLIIQGIETLSLRIDKHVANAQALAEWLEQRDEVEKVHYAGLPSSPWYQNAQKYLPKGAGAIVSFELRGGVEAGRAFVDGTELFSQLANIGDVRSLIVHPASTTHSQLSPDEQVTTGVTPGLVRLSVGIEGIEDLKADLEAGFRAAKSAQ
ncbi:MAG: PLP-dependent transferase, partial [Umezawaea sp.]